jgi:hypothetical protein
MTPEEALSYLDNFADDESEAHNVAALIRRLQQQWDDPEHDCTWHAHYNAARPSVKKMRERITELERIARSARAPGLSERIVERDEQLERAEKHPVPMILYCPMCTERHIDEGSHATRSHKSHACQHCGHVWRPALVPTIGVKFLPGFQNEPTGATTQQNVELGRRLWAYAFRVPLERIGTEPQDDTHAAALGRRARELVNP